jgi:hypothetical protein
VHDQIRTEATVTVLKPVSVAFAAASLLGLAALTPAHAQTGYPGVENASPGTNLPYPGPQAGTPNAQSTYPAAQPGYAAPPPATAYPAPPSQPAYPAPPLQTAYPAPPSQQMGPGPQIAYPAPGTNTQLITNGPQSSGVEQSGTWSPRQNVIQSRHYTHLIDTDRAFRDARMRKECGPITDPQLHQQCIASFNRYAPT